ncbi:helix-turn-helix domain-containing protein, partial [Psychroflexus planctonicus]|uniref:helix-turn-helix domain-containing protein n=1 Tax=Psychroflexus planctonicus TaxID=1526575 RepID=UPI00166D5C82
MIKSGKRLGARKIYSENFKLRIVKLYESGKHSVYELEKIYDISNPTIYNWIY